MNGNGEKETGQCHRNQGRQKRDQQASFPENKKDNHSDNDRSAECECAGPDGLGIYVPTRGIGVRSKLFGEFPRLIGVLPEDYLRLCSRKYP